MHHHHRRPFSTSQASYTAADLDHFWERVYWFPYNQDAKLHDIDSVLWQTRASDRVGMAVGRVCLRDAGWQIESPHSKTHTEAGVIDCVSQWLIIEKCPFREGSILTELQTTLGESLDHISVYKLRPWVVITYHLNLLHSPMVMGTILCNNRGTAAGCARWGNARMAEFAGKGMRERLAL